MAQRLNFDLNELQILWNCDYDDEEIADSMGLTVEQVKRGREALGLPEN